jgi:hypothetical protein
MQYRINVAKREQIRLRYGKMEDSYHHYFRIISDKMIGDVIQIVREMEEKYPAPEYKVELYRDISHYEKVILPEKEAMQ